MRLSPERLNRYLALRDLTDPDQGRHAINILVTNLTSAIEQWPIDAQARLAQRAGRQPRGTEMWQLATLAAVALVFVVEIELIMRA